MAEFLSNKIMIIRIDIYPCKTRTNHDCEKANIRYLKSCT